MSHVVRKLSEPTYDELKHGSRIETKEDPEAAAPETEAPDDRQATQPPLAAPHWV